MQAGPPRGDAVVFEIRQISTSMHADGESSSLTRFAEDSSIPHVDWCRTRGYELTTTPASNGRVGISAGTMSGDEPRGYRAAVEALTAELVPDGPGGDAFRSLASAVWERVR